MLSKKNISVRLARKGDLGDVCAIDSEAFSPYGTAELPSIFISRWDVFSQGFVVAEENEHIIGYGTSEKWSNDHEPAMNEDPHKSHNSKGGVFCITAMAVRKEWREFGVGSIILDTLIQIAKDEHCQAVVLETTHAQNFYLKRGFHETGEREQMGTNLTILTLNLDQG